MYVLIEDRVGDLKLSGRRVSSWSPRSLVLVSRWVLPRNGPTGLDLFRDQVNSFTVSMKTTIYIYTAVVSGQEVFWKGKQVTHPRPFMS